MNLKDQLQTMANGKNASYSAIADYLLARKSYAGLKLKEVAHACHVSDATVVRFCQNLGFDGFSDLKYNLTKVPFPCPIISARTFLQNSGRKPEKR